MQRACALLLHVHEASVSQSLSLLHSKLCTAGLPLPNSALNCCIAPCCMHTHTDSRFEISGEAGCFGADDWLETTSHMSAADAAERSRERSGAGSSAAGSVRRMSNAQALRDADDSNLLSRSRMQRISIGLYCNC
jgi:hypothetical protein